VGLATFGSAMSGPDEALDGMCRVRRNRKKRVTWYSFLVSLSGDTVGVGMVRYRFNRLLVEVERHKRGRTMGKLDGKVALVTGGDSGIGLATAQRLVADGAYVFITGRRARELDAAVEQIGPNVTAVQGDVSQLADLDRVIATVKELKGRIDIVFANAGIGQGAPLGAISEEQFDRTFGVNVKGALFTVQKALPLLPDGASIILTSSIVGSKGFADRSVYSATKAALRSFARTWTADLQRRQIRVNVVSPGVIDTPGLRRLDQTDGEGLNARYRDRVPLGRVGRPEDIASAVAFLASDESSYVSGIELFIDGGFAQV
jgi:NAD(P)-dependent dehydrogenase (short-subunit alcohol dehydrogenase family)